MREIVTVRDLEMVTSEIKYAQKQGARQLVSNLIEIGRLLSEAKTMVQPRDWESYIWDNFGYSTSSADNWMKLYREYGEDQESLFDSFRNSQTFGKLSYTQLLALTAIPAEERAEFAEKHGAENLSTRELQRAIKERDEALAEAEKAKKHTEDLEKTVIAQADLLEIRDETIENRDRMLRLAQEKTEAAEKKAGRVAQLEDELDKAMEAKKKAEAALAESKENPEIPAELMERIRKEAEAAYAEIVRKDIEKELEAAREQAQKAQKAAKLQNPELMAVQVLGQKLLSDWNTILGHRKKAIGMDGENRNPLDAFLGKLIDTMCHEWKD